MERFNTFSLRKKEVINLSDGCRLGYPTDFEFDSCNGKILSVIVPQFGGFWWFGHCSDLIIPWSRIECIGEDAILVRLAPSELTSVTERGRKEK